MDFEVVFCKCWVWSMGMFNSDANPCTSDQMDAITGGANAGEYSTSATEGVLNV